MKQRFKFCKQTSPKKRSMRMSNMNNQCRTLMSVTLCQLLREPAKKQSHEARTPHGHDHVENREMIFVACDITLTFWLCFLLFYCIVFVKSFESDKKKDLGYVSDEKIFQKHYQFEDFFWTGSGHDPEADNIFTNETHSGLDLIESSSSDAWKTTTVFHTTTILFATVFSNSEGCENTNGTCTPQVSPVQTKSIDFSLPTYPPKVPEILPCPTQKIPQTDIIQLPDGFYSDNDIEGSNSFGSSSVPPKKDNEGRNISMFPTIALDFFNFTSTTVFPKFPLDKKYWIMTVLRNDFPPNIELNSTENKLSSLYRKAFSRRQQTYFGESDFQDRKERKLSQSVRVHIVNVTRTGNNVEIVYFVSLAGEPVPALTAANDMRLMTTSEVIAELGYPILSKAEPYVKNEVPLGARVKGRTRDTWLLIGSVIAAVILLIILAVLFALGLSKNRTNRSTKGMDKRKQIFEDAENGRRNLAFESDDDIAKDTHTHRSRSQQEDSKSTNLVTKAGVKFTEEPKSISSSSSCSGSSEASLVRLRHQQKRKERRQQEGGEKPKPKPRTRIRRIENSDGGKKFKRNATQSAGSAISRDTFNEITTEGYDDMDYSPRMTRSPTSYLSMPSVRAFPRGTRIPEPLAKVLEPTSIRHLDADSDSPCECPQYTQIRHEVDVEQVCEVKNKFVKRKNMTRHASLEGEDPGFIGPVVWNRHCQKLGERETVNIEERDENISIGRMRKRFTELLDDALSMFGSRHGSPERVDIVHARQSDNRVHSAAARTVYLSTDNSGNVRPKTTGSKRPQSAVVSGPRGAWETPSCSTLARSDTVGNVQTPPLTIDRNLIYVDADLPPRDAAVPLITAIKNELKKFENPSNDNP